MTTSFEIDAKLLERHIVELGRVGLDPSGGLFRPVYGSAWREAAERVGLWFREAGLEVRIDAVGNVVGRLAAADAAAGCVLSGSHIDTVKHGGAYDGALGIHAALAAISALAKANGQPRKHLEVVALCEEEGSRFNSNFWGSRAMTGRITATEVDTLRDTDGATIGQAMRDCGLDPAALSSAHRNDIDAFLELHIEQGRILEDEHLDVGVVDAITGTRHYRVHVSGEADHAGTTPMDLRHDAMTATADMALRISQLAERMGRPAVATVGRISLEPGAINVVPGGAIFTIDTRHPDATRRITLTDGIENILRDTARAHDVQVDWQVLAERLPVPMDSQIKELAERCVRAENLSYKVMPSGAGHDSQIMATAVPTGMVFVPSQGGRSHRPDEFTSIDQVVPGVRVLARMLHELAY